MSIPTICGRCTKGNNGRCSKFLSSGGSAGKGTIGYYTGACDLFDGFTIEGVVEKPLHRFADERGWLMEVLRSDDESYPQFGQMYVTVSYPTTVKGFHYHRIQHDFIISLPGMIKVALYDGREDSPTHGKIQEYYIGPDNPTLLGIPPGVYHGWKAYTDMAYVISCPTELYNRESPDEYRIDPHTPNIDYDWGRIDR